MRKLFLSFSMLLLGLVSFGQAVNESAIIPVSVTMNTVSRLTIESGGNIKFVFNSINDYNTGFDGSVTPLYTTTVSVSSSTNFSVDLYSEGDFQPTDNAANSLAIGQLEYQLVWNGTNAQPTDITIAWTQMTNAAVHVIDNITTAGNGGLAGDGTANRFDIEWKIGTATNTFGGTFLSQGNIAADHYVANIFIELLN